MTVQEIMDLALLNSHTKSAQLGTNSATNQLIWFNIIRKDLGQAIITKVNENYFFQIWTRDAVASQNNGEYPYPEQDDDSAGMLKCLRLSVKTDNDDDYYTPADEIDIKTLPRDWAYYLANQPRANPIYFLGDESFFVAPQFAVDNLPTSPSGNAQIKLYGTAKLIDLAAGAAASTILIPDDFHHLIAIGMEQYILKNRGKRAEATAAKNEYEYEKNVMIDELSNRDESNMQAALPDDTNLQYAE